jgi:hypothetical protein
VKLPRKDDAMSLLDPNGTSMSELIKCVIQIDRGSTVSFGFPAAIPLVYNNMERESKSCSNLLQQGNTTFSNIQISTVQFPENNRLIQKHSPSGLFFHGRIRERDSR